MAIITIIHSYRVREPGFQLKEPTTQPRSGTKMFLQQIYGLISWFL